MWEEVKGWGGGGRGGEREIGRKGPKRERISRDKERRGQGVGVCVGGWGGGMRKSQNDLPQLKCHH